MWFLVGCCETFTSLWVDTVCFMGIYARSNFYLIFKVTNFYWPVITITLTVPPPPSNHISSFHVSVQVAESFLKLNDTGFQDFTASKSKFRRSQWPRGQRRRYAVARLLRSWVRIPLEAWMFFCCKCCVLSSTGLCDELITRPEESYRLWCVVVCDLETSRMMKPWPALGRRGGGKV